jgi:hypothetical protein
MSSLAQQAYNPFTEQVAGEYFVGREEQIELFQGALAGLREGNPRHLYVAGVHGTGKTSYLAKLIEISRAGGFIGTVATLDAAASTKQHVSTILKSVIASIDAAQQPDSAGAGALRRDWDLDETSQYFRLPKNELLESDDLRHDFNFLLTEARTHGVKGIAVCIDEGQRIDPFAFSALKNALQSLSGYLVVISLRIVQDKSSAVEQGRRILEDKATEAEGDIGASRFFVRGVPLGPFSSEDEVRQCVKKRLTDNVISFDEEVINEVGHITGRLPSSIIALSSDIYDLAVETSSVIAGMPTLNASFQRRFSEYYSPALSLVGSLSHGGRAILHALLALGRPVTVVEVVLQAYPSMPSDVGPTLAAGISGELGRLCQSSLCIQKDDKFEIANSYARYALEQALTSP